MKLSFIVFILLYKRNSIRVNEPVEKKNITLSNEPFTISKNSVMSSCTVTFAPFGPGGPGGPWGPAGPALHP